MSWRITTPAVAIARNQFFTFNGLNNKRRNKASIACRIICAIRK